MWYFNCITSLKFCQEGISNFFEFFSTPTLALLLGRHRGFIFMSSLLTLLLYHTLRDLSRGFPNLFWKSLSAGLVGLHSFDSTGSPSEIPEPTR